MNEQTETMNATKRQTKSTRIDGASLRPDLDRNRASVETTCAYWVGLTHDCPMDVIDVAGVHFPKNNGEQTMIDGRTKLVPCHGTLVHLTRDKIESLRNKLPLTVIRWSAGENVEKRTASLVKIPSPEDIAERQKLNRPIVRYTQSKHDVAAVDYMYCVLCEDQQDPDRGGKPPKTIAESGLEWPESL